MVIPTLADELFCAGFAHHCHRFDSTGERRGDSGVHLVNNGVTVAANQANLFP